MKMLVSARFGSDMYVWARVEVDVELRDGLRVGVCRLRSLYITDKMTRSVPLTDVIHEQAINAIKAEVDERLNTAANSRHVH